MTTKMTAEERAAKLAVLYDGQPMTISLKVWTSYDPNTRKRQWEMRDFVIDNLQHIRAELSGIELLDMRYVKDNPDLGQPETYAIKRSDPSANASLPKQLHGLRAGTRKVPGASQRDLRLASYLVK